jgi:hypothetical protein
MAIEDPTPTTIPFYRLQNSEGPRIYREPLNTELVVAGSVIPAVLPSIPAVVPPIHTVFDAVLVAVSRSGAGREKRASRGGCEHEQERSCDPLSRDGAG